MGRDLGFGARSWRYAMVVDDGVIEKMFIEPQKPGDPYEISDADTVLAYVAPGRKVPEDVALLSSRATSNGVPVGKSAAPPEGATRIRGHGGRT